MRNINAEFQLISQQLLNMTRYISEKLDNGGSVLLADKIAILNGLSDIVQGLNTSTANIQVDINSISSKVLKQEGELLFLYFNFALSVFILITTVYIILLSRSQNTKLLSFSGDMQRLLNRPSENRQSLHQEAVSRNTTTPPIVEGQTTQQEQLLQDPHLEELALSDQGTENLNSETTLQRAGNSNSTQRSANSECCDISGSCFRPSPFGS